MHAHYEAGRDGTAWLNGRQSKGNRSLSERESLFERRGAGLLINMKPGRGVEACNILK